MMNMDTYKKHTLPRAIILAACSLLLAGACDNRAYEGMDPDTQAREVPLNFNASIENTEVAQSRTIIHSMEGGLTGNAYKFGMSITKSENGSEIFSGSSDMTATMSRKNGSGPWNWSFIDNSNNQGVTPVGPEGKALKVVAYYPMVETFTKDVYTDGIPFDFSAKTGLMQKDLLYNTKTDYPFTPSDAPVATIPLNFRHAYTWIVLNITKYVEKDKQVKLSSVSLDNLGGSWIKNNGAIDPATGLAMDRSIAGPIGVTLTPPGVLSTTTPLTYEFLVPSFMDPKVGNGEIALVLNIDGIDELFNLDKAYLNKSDDGKSYGFRQGYKNTYNLVYNNSALNLTILNWSSEVIEGEFGGTITPPGDTDYKLVDFKDPGYFWPSATLPGGQGWAEKYPPQPNYLGANDHPYEKYLTTVAYGGNGEYVPVNSPSPPLPTDGLKITDDINVYTREQVFQKIQITKEDVSVAPVPWEDGNGLLVAKELCRKYNGGGFRNWRLPRASELRAVLVLVSANGSKLSGLNFGKDENRNKPYWTGTEVKINEAWGMYIDYTGNILTTKLVLSPYDKKEMASVRCVRDSN
jgi:hypothetical protein